ncbi:MAG: hypothetical protein L0211_07440 [Planctomycetaceae bacterium]|nr:hypothetical protein [Planctomycetaceae bacterium]
MDIRNRVKKLQQIRAGDLVPHPRNFRTHSQEQRATIRAVFAEIGFAGAALVYKSKRAGGKLTVIDGHMRDEEVGPDYLVPCLVTDLNDDEADKLLAIFDRLGTMAGADPDKVKALLADIETGSDEIDALLASLGEAAGLQAAGGEIELKRVSEQPPPKMSWVLIGIPTVRFGELANLVESVAGIPDTIVETTVSNG